MKKIPHVVTLTPSARWRSSIQFHLTQAISDVKFIAALDIQNCLHEVRLLQPVAAIVELDLARLPVICEMLRQRLPEFPGTVFLAVGEQDLQPWLSLLRISGFSDVCCDIARIGTMCKRIKRHAENETAHRMDAKIEDTILEQLPWKAIRAGNAS